MRKTTTNVTRFVQELMISCQVSEKCIVGPVTAHITMVASANRNAQGEPTAPALTVAKSVNQRLRVLESRCLVILLSDESGGQKEASDAGKAAENAYGGGKAH